MADQPDRPRTYRVQARHREPLIAWMRGAFERSGCRIIRASPPSEAPFRISFETASGDRLGIIAYAFLANTRVTRNRPGDEHRFQVKYGTKDGRTHDIWQDPYGIYTTLFLGINPDQGFFVGADPVLHSPTKLFISIEFKQLEVDTVLRQGWHAWERDRRSGDEGPVEVLVGGTADSFLRYVLFERDALGEDQGHRHLLAEKSSMLLEQGPVLPSGLPVPRPSMERLHDLGRELEMSQQQVLDLIAQSPYLKMAVRGGAAEHHLAQTLASAAGISDVCQVRDSGELDVTFRHRGRLIGIQCKNVLRKRARDGSARLDFQRTRAAKSDPCSRYYSPSDFDVAAACLHAVEEKWTFRFALPRTLDPHPRCEGKLNSNVRIDDRWTEDLVHLLARGTAA